MRSSHRAADHSFYFLIIAGLVIDPDTIDVSGILDLAHGAEWYVKVAIGIILVAFLHLGFEDSDHGKADAIATYRLAERRHTGKELCLRLGTYHDDARLLVHVVFVEETSLLESKRADPGDAGISS